MITRFKPFFYALSGLMVAAAVAALAIWGLPLGIDFTGGALLEVRFTGEDPASERAQADLPSIFSQFSITPQIQNVGEDGLVARFPEVSDETYRQLMEALREQNPTLAEDRFESIGPTIGQETRDRAVIATLLVLGTVLVYVAWAFRKLTHPLSSWKYGVVTVAAMVHDIIITLGFVAVLARFTSSDIGVAFVAALLMVVGYSMNDNIVIFDRLRENLARATGRVSFAETVERSVRETLARSFNTSFSTILVLSAVLVFGGGTMLIFISTLIAGIVVGTYSSLFFSIPLLLDWAGRRGK